MVGDCCGLTVVNGGCYGVVSVEVTDDYFEEVARVVKQVLDGTVILLRYVI